MKANFAKYYIILKKYEIIIAASVVLLVVIILSVLFLMPQLTQANQIFVDKEVLIKQQEDLQRKDRALTSLDFKYYKDIYPKLAQVLPDSKDYVSLFNTFDSLEAQFSVTILRTDFQLGVISTTSAKLTKESGIEGYTIPLTIDVIGKHEQLRQFFASLSSLEGRIITVEEIRWKIDEDDLIQASFKGKAYFYPPPTKLGPLNKPLPQISTRQDEMLEQIASSKVIPQAKIQIEDINVGKRNLFK